MDNLDQIKQRQQATWATGNFHVIGVGAAIVGERLCAELGLSAGQLVLDVACGSGNTTLAAARRQTHATGVDFVPALLERARMRAKAEDLEAEFVEGDAEALPFEDGSFDRVVSTFGAMFAPDQERTAGELLRVCKPGGRIGMANWTPGGMAGQLFQLGTEFVPPPPSLRPPTDWGAGPRLQQLFGHHVSYLQTSDHTLRSNYASPAAFVDKFRTFFGPTARLFEALDKDQAREYETRLKDLVVRFNQATDGSLTVRQDYVNVVAVKRP